MINEELGKRYSKKNEAMADTKTVSIGFTYADENGSTVTVEKIENGICHVVEKFNLKDVATFDLVQSIYDDSKNTETESILTGDYAKNLGFELVAENYDSKRYRKGKYFLSFRGNEVVFGIKESKSSPFIPLKKRVNFTVHKLQNLYYYLEDEELAL